MDSSIKCMMSVISNFLNFTSKEISEIDSTDIDDWLDKKYNNAKPSTIAHHLSILSVFFQYCYLEEYISKVPVKKDYNSTLPIILPKYLERQELAKFKAGIFTLKLRDQLIVKLLECTGIRRSELSSINIEDIDLDNSSIDIVTKGHKEKNHTVYFNEEFSWLLNKYLLGINQKKGPLFRNKFGERLSDKSVYNIVVKYGESISLEKRLHPHILRHSFCTTLIINVFGKLKFKQSGT